ncbi:MAG: hypothetical protein GEV07_27630 [Streptosporangiales bacterium]|nr:hypothetical protein [Streptosporangiales bacterium]
MGSCNVAALRAVGNNARGFEDRAKASSRAVGMVTGSAAAGRSGTLLAGKELDRLVSSWRDGQFHAQAVSLLSVGDKIVTTANHYGGTDNVMANEFHYEPSLADRKGI